MNKYYPVKQIYFFNKSICVLCQQENGPCPLLAIANCLLLTERISLPPDVPSITPQYLLNLLGDYLMERTTLHEDPDIRVQQQDQISTTIKLLPRLLYGMDINVYFSRADKFEFTEELNVFDAFGVSIYHGWLLDEQDTATAGVVKDMAYNELLTKLVHHKDGDEASEEEKVIESFLTSTASQLTYAGLVALHETVKPNQVAVFFRNNHFSTILKYNDKLYLLVTDIGYAYETTVVWELLDDIAGNTEYTDGFFLLNTRPPPPSPTKDPAATPLPPGTYCRPPSPPAVHTAANSAASQTARAEQIADSGMADPANADLLMTALGTGSDISDTSLEIIGEHDDAGHNDDYEMALRLQEEMDRDYSMRQQQQQQRAADQGVVPSYGAGPQPGGGDTMDLSPDVIIQQEEILRNIQAEKEGLAHNTNRGHGCNRSSRHSGCVVS